MKRTLFGVVLLLAFSVIDLKAIGLIVVDNPEEVQIQRVPPQDRMWPLPPHWLPRPIYRYTPLEIRSVKATAKIHDQVAQTQIEQEFYNPNPRRLEGTFLLPLPKGAHLEKFKMEVNGKMMEAELLKADKAKGIYEEIVRKAKDPALLEYVGRDLIKVRIFPIEANSTKRIQVSYTQVLKKDSGLVEYSLPLNIAKYSATPVRNFSLKLEVNSSTDLKTLYSPTHTIEIKKSGTNRATVGLEQSETKPDKDFQFFYSAEEQDLGLNFMTYKKAGEDGYFMLIASPGFERKKGDIVPKDVVFVLDTSGSMSGPKIEQAKKSLLFCVNSLNDQDRFEIIRFSTDTEALFKKMTEVSDMARKQAKQFVEDLKAIGGTAINDALQEALERKPKDSSRPFMVVFLTDGLPTIGVTNEEEILKNVRARNEGLTRIFCFGLGTDVNTHLLDKLAEDTGAVSQYVLPDEDIEVKVSSFFTKISDPVLADVQIDFGKIHVSKMHPKKLPDLFKGQQLIVLGRYDEGGRARAKVEGKVGEESKTFRYPVEFAKEDTEHEFIPRLWANRRVGYLLDEIRLHGENAELKEEVTDLGKNYGIVTPYTSYLVSEDMPAVAMRGMVPLNERVESQAFMLRQPEAASRYAPNLLNGREKSGDIAVLSSRYGKELQTATSEQALSQSGTELRRYAISGRLQRQIEPLTGQPMAADSAAAVQSQRRFVGARTFQMENGVWTDTAVQSVKDTAVIQVVFDSPEYWELVGKLPELKDVFALGTKVKFAHGGRVYEITSSEK